MSMYELGQSFSGTLAAIAGVFILIFLAPFLIALAIGTAIALWQHSFSPIWSSLFYALICDVVILALGGLIYMGLIIHDKFFD